MLIEEPRDERGATAWIDALADSFGSTSIVVDEARSARGVTTLAELLRTTSGLVLQESFEGPRPSIRGLGINSAPSNQGVVLLVDGLPLARADGLYSVKLNRIS